MRIAAGKRTEPSVMPCATREFAFHSRGGFATFDDGVRRALLGWEMMGVVLPSLEVYGDQCRWTAPEARPMTRDEVRQGWFATTRRQSRQRSASCSAVHARELVEVVGLDYVAARDRRVGHRRRSWPTEAPTRRGSGLSSAERGRGAVAYPVAACSRASRELASPRAILVHRPRRAPSRASPRWPALTPPPPAPPHRHTLQSPHESPRSPLRASRTPRTHAPASALRTALSHRTDRAGLRIEDLLLTSSRVITTPSGTPSEASASPR